MKKKAKKKIKKVAKETLISVKGGMTATVARSTIKQTADDQWKVGDSIS